MAGAGQAKYRPYPAYKPSGVEWTHDFPEGWELKPLAVLCDFQQGKAHEPFIDDAGQFICVNARFVSTEGVARKYCNKNLTPAEKDDILIVMSDLPNGRALAKAFFVDDESPYAVNQRVCRLTATYADSRFLFYQLSRNPYFLRYDDGSNQTHLSNAAFTKFPALVPSLPEQTKIAAFLDYETAKIDALIAKQKRLIALLEEKRQAVISHAVTKGLNPTAPLRPSGIDWLGDVPEHWGIKKVSWGFKATKGKNGQLLTKEYCAENSGPHPVYSGQTENEGVLGRISWYEFDFGQEGSLFATTVGTKAMNLSFLSGKLSLSQNCMLITPTAPELLTRFYFYHLQPLFRFERGLIPDHMQASFRMEDLYQYRHAVLPENEQQEIVDFLDHETAKFDDLVAKAQSAVTLLKERRTALISAAVTGKIDVRDWQQPQPLSDTDLSTEDLQEAAL